MFLNVPEICLYQGSEYTSGFQYAKILSIPEFCINQGYAGLRICLNILDAILISDSKIQSARCVYVKCEPNNFRAARCDSRNLLVVSYNSTSL